MRRREFLLGGAGLAAGVLTAGCGAGPQSPPKAATQKAVPPKIDGDLLIFNWTEYMNPKVIKRFEKHYGVSVTVSNFDSMPGMMAKLRSGNRYDLIFPTADYVARLNRLNQLRPLDRAVLKNSDGIYDFFDDPWYDKDSAHTVPYGMYTTGIAWRSDLAGDLTPGTTSRWTGPRATPSCSTTSRRASDRPTCSTASTSTRQRRTSSTRPRRRSSTRRSSCAAIRPTRHRTS
jgi:spermidine/putrescine transport system substrate-binding protein